MCPQSSTDVALLTLSTLNIFSAKFSRLMCCFIYNFGPIFPNWVASSKIVSLTEELSTSKKHGKHAQSHRSSRFEMLFKIGILKIFTIFTGKYLCWSLILIKLQACATLLKGNFSSSATSLDLTQKHKCFPVNIAKLLRTAFFIEHLVTASEAKNMKYFGRKMNHKGMTFYGRYQHIIHNQTKTKSYKYVSNIM